MALRGANPPSAPAAEQAPRAPAAPCPRSPGRPRTAGGGGAGPLPPRTASASFPPSSLPPCRPGLAVPAAGGRDARRPDGAGSAALGARRRLRAWAVLHRDCPFSPSSFLSFFLFFFFPLCHFPLGTGSRIRAPGIAMPAELSRAVGMHAISDLHSSLPLRLLNKGPEYLRRQLEAGKPGRKSAVERLAADKAKYVKSQRVISTRQDPVIALSSASESGSESCSVESRAASAEPGRGPGAKPLERGRAVSSCRAPLQHGPPIARRSTRRQMRPDSLVIYRQKCELGRGQSQDSSRGNLVRRIFHGSIKEKQLASPELPRVMEDVAATESSERLSAKDGDREPSDHGVVQTIPVGTEGAGVCTEERERPSKLSTPPEEVKEVKRRGLHRSQSDISSRYSKSFADFETFFKYCGLEQEVIEDLGRENFSVVSDNVSFKIRSISVATSESEFTRHSGDEGLLEDELTEQVPSSTSVIERNARIIKWLYTCKKARETGQAIRELA
ncbi:protein FAM110C [Prinia subflava]|uniref:protein FAM110C n=1 Tax=Prinia subflava TaxID=208062 RepID=UPI002FE1C4D6